MAEKQINSLGNRLKTLIPAGKSQNDFADDVGVAVSTFKSWLADISPPKADSLLRIASLTGCDLNWLISGKGSAGMVDDADFQLVRRYDVSFSAGAGAAMNGEQEAEPIGFRKDWLKKHIGVSAENLSVIEARGDSMEPTIRDGSLVLLNHLIERIKNDGIYAFRIDDTLYIKRIQKLPDGRLKIKSDNDFYDDLFVENPPADNFVIIGQVKWAGNTF